MAEHTPGGLATDTGDRGYGCPASTPAASEAACPTEMACAVSDTATSGSPSVREAVLYTNALLWRQPFPLSGQCLPRALSLYYFATRCGLPVRFHCGVYRTGASLGGHAWLSLHGAPFMERENPAERYAVTFSFPIVPIDAMGSMSLACERSSSSPKRMDGHGDTIGW